MCEENLWALWFQSVPGIGRRTIYHLEETFGSLRQATAASEEELRTVLRPPQIKSLREFSQTPDGLMRQCERAGVEYVTVWEERFPGRLKEIPDPPYGIFMKGALPAPDRPAVAMIGARACSAYGREAARLMGSAAAAAGIQVISGMARGIDSISQRACLDGGGKSFAVLGSGADVCYPPEARPLYEQLASEGGIISEYPLHMQPLNQNFPPRNRLISGLADLVLVIEAREKSGTLITVDMALEQGREVAVLPGRITDALSQGCHKLYSQGAHLVTSPQEMTQMVWEAFALRRENRDRGVVRKTVASGDDRDLAGDVVRNEHMAHGFSCPRKPDREVSVQKMKN
ncbi:MAG: DNA-processing protein DprA [Lachnospiraceae bacterium]|nr:DNA-processing protein DprA [Lachnospiraceae bacterium]